MVISCKYWHLCRPVPGLLHPLAQARKFESIVFPPTGSSFPVRAALPVRAAVAKGGRTEIHPPFFPLECVYTGILFFTAAAVGAFDFGIAVPACCKVAKTHAFAAVHKRTRRTAAAPVAVRR